MKRLKTLLLALALLAVCFDASSCMFFSIRPERVDKDQKTVYSWSAAKAHLRDGSVVVFPAGFKMAKGVIKGERGVRYDLLRRKTGYVQSVSCDSVACLQVYKDRVLPRSAVGFVAVPVYFLTLFVASLPHWGGHTVTRK